MELASRQKQINAISWYHDFDFGHGLRALANTPQTDWHRLNWHFVEEKLKTIPFQDRTVLDVGCWDGYWSFFAEKQGASSVLATDDFSQNWSNGRGILLAKELLNSQIEIHQQLSVYDLSSLERKFDIILFLGVYYHLLDPLYALAQIRHCCHENTIVVIEGNEGWGLPGKSTLLDLSHRTSKFLPSATHLEELLRLTYFQVTDQFEMELPPNHIQRIGWRSRLAMCKQALFGSRSGVAKTLEQWLAVRRILWMCLPFQGENNLHVYRPPFGLDAYDTRFSQDAIAPELPYHLSFQKTCVNQR